MPRTYAIIKPFSEELVHDFAATKGPLPSAKGEAVTRFLPQDWRNSLISLPRLLPPVDRQVEQPVAVVHRLEHPAGNLSTTIHALSSGKITKTDAD
jgi:hypothetical protein